MSTTDRRHRWLAVVPMLVIASACSSGGEHADTTTAAPAATMGHGGNPADTGMGTKSHGMEGMNHGATTDSAARRDSAAATRPAP
jgi:hypothetical protein